ncbi:MULTISPECIES: YdaU family protein [Halocynthiibacter]|uniref:YdaU family protein n=1 Tax=Halocynthiibacter halioticoli TaxID=2986804 RepID=A0AAE3LRZ6_9RHOB|nr:MULTISPECIES: YdaU family protein [Halocynthiibacter]MCV6826017.1 YdaU family protein [Halocynthiibacter halioticoli]MCW4059018.1 YdaU family protein [Halocynthiibacter sp. SDUM655004]
MNGLPYYKAYPRDFIEGTIGMPFEVKCAYRVVLDIIYMQGGNLPDDARYISGLLGCSIRKWKSIRKHLVDAGKVEVSGEFLTNNRAEKELESLAKLQDKQREKRSRPNKNNNLQSPQSHQPKPEPEPEPERVITTTTKRIVMEADCKPPENGGGGGSSRSIPIDDDRKRILAAVGSDRYGFTDFMEAKRWSDELSLTLEAQEAVITDVMDGRSDPPNSLKFFTPAMQRAAGADAQPALTPTAPQSDGRKTGTGYAEELRKIFDEIA